MRSFGPALALSVVLAAFAALFFSRSASAQSVLSAPVVVVYPFTVGNSGTDAQAGGNVAVLLATRLQSLGGITVKPFTPGTGRPDYLSAAEKENADYYVTGFLTPIGDEVSLITQVVSTYSGSVVWSNSSIIRTYADALGQADPLHAAILSHAGRSLASIGSQPVSSTPAPSSSAGPGVNLTKALRHHRREAAPAPSPSAAGVAPLAAASVAPALPRASPAAPAPAVTQARAPAEAVVLAAAAPAGVLVTDVGGSADAALRAYAANSLAAALHRDGRGGGGIGVSGGDAVANAAQLCKANPGSSALYVGTLGTGPDVTLDVAAFDCTGKAIASYRAVERPRRHRSLEDAIDRAAAQIAAALTKGNAAGAH
jgi:TolB-like protein